MNRDIGDPSVREGVSKVYEFNWNDSDAWISIERVTSRAVIGTWHDQFNVFSWLLIKPIFFFSSIIDLKANNNEVALSRDYRGKRKEAPTNEIIITK